MKLGGNMDPGGGGHNIIWIQAEVAGGGGGNMAPGEGGVVIWSQVGVGLIQSQVWWGLYGVR